jgi:hypothetical protein
MDTPYWPTAHTSLGPMATTAVRDSARRVGLGVRNRSQVDPFHRSVSARPRDQPTAHTFVAEDAETSDRRPDIGNPRTLSHDPQAPNAGWTHATVTPITAKATHTIGRRRTLALLLTSRRLTDVSLLTYLRYR